MAWTRECGHLAEFTSENLNRLQLEDKESQIIINVSTDKRNGSNYDLEMVLFGMKNLHHLLESYVFQCLL